jgi:hypothetical protein
LAAPVIVVALVVLCYRIRSWRDLVGPTLLLGAGTLFPLLLMLLYLGANNALPAAIEQIWSYNAAYSRVGWEQRFARIDQFVWGHGLMGPLGVLAWLGAGYGLLRRQVQAAHRPLLLFALLDWPLEWALALLPGRDYGHYLVPLLWPEAILLCWGLSFLLQRFQLSQPRQVFAASFALLLLGTAPLFAWVQIVTVTSPFAMNRLPFDLVRLEAVRTIQQVEREADVYIWGAETALYVAARREAPFRLVYPYALHTMNYAPDALVSELRSGLNTNPPTLIIDSSPTDSGVVPLDPTKRARWQATTHALDSAVAALCDELFARYEYVGLIGGVWPMYRLR